MNGEVSVRSRAVITAVISWWAAVICAFIAICLFASTASSAIRIATWLIGFSALFSLIGWMGSIGSLINDRGRIRLGGGLLMTIPFVGAGFGIAMTRSTTIAVHDPLVSAWAIITGLIVVIATLIVCAPVGSYRPGGHDG